MNGFEKHGIDHLSASSINLWTNAPDVWVASYLFKKRTPFGAAAYRGIVIEDAVVDVLTSKKDVKSATTSAVSRFNQQFGIQAMTDEKVGKEAELIEPMISMALEQLVDHGKPQFPKDGKQEKISITAKFDDWSIPIIGYLDLVFPDVGMVIDLKTTTRVPSKMSAEHQLQRAIYQAAKGNQVVKFLYVSGKKTALLEDGDVSDVLRRAKVIIARLERFLSVCDKETARQIVPLTNNFYWSGGEAVREELYGV
jgi:hypothetical protein